MKDKIDLQFYPSLPYAIAVIAFCIHAITAFMKV